MYNNADSSVESSTDTLIKRYSETYWEIIDVKEYVKKAQVSSKLSTEWRRVVSPVLSMCTMDDTKWSARITQ